MALHFHICQRDWTKRVQEPLTPCNIKYRSLESWMRRNSHVRFGTEERPCGPTYRYSLSEVFLLRIDNFSCLNRAELPPTLVGGSSVVGVTGLA